MTALAPPADTGHGFPGPRRDSVICALTGCIQRRRNETSRPPTLPADVLAAYQPGKQSTQYSIGDHPNLTGGAMAALFQDLGQRIVGIDPCVTEEFLKLYVAFKAETNFVNVVRRAKRSRLSLNLGFHKIDDPKGLCVDVSNVGRWGNDDVDVCRRPSNCPTSWA